MMFEVIDGEKAKDHRIGELLEGAGLAGYYFGSFFTLVFEREQPGENPVRGMVSRIELTIRDEAWFGKRDDWKKRIDSSEIDLGPEPGEPLIAHELTRIRWSGGEVVEGTNLTGGVLVISFSGGESLTINAAEDAEDYSWEIKGYKERGENPGNKMVVAITCDSREVVITEAEMK